MFSDLGTI